MIKHLNLPFSHKGYETNFRVLQLENLLLSLFMIGLGLFNVMAPINFFISLTFKRHKNSNFVLPTNKCYVMRRLAIKRFSRYLTHNCILIGKTSEVEVGIVMGNTRGNVNYQTKKKQSPTAYSLLEQDVSMTN